jgi:hypothetical protein
MDMTDATEWEGVLLGRKVRRSMGDAQMVRWSAAVYCDNFARMRAGDVLFHKRAETELRLS